MAKSGAGNFIPLEPEEFHRIKPGEIIQVDWSKPRNPGFHRKAFALFKLIYDALPDSMEPVMIGGDSVVPMRDFDETRKWLTVKAGFYDVIGYPDGSVRVRAKSLRYASMDEIEFALLYNNLVTLAIQYIPHFVDSDQVEALVNEAMNFA